MQRWEQLPVEQQAGGQGAVAHGLRRDVLLLLGQAQQLLRDLKGDVLAGPMQVMLEQPAQRGQKLRDLVLSRAQLPGSGVGFLHLGRRPALGGDERCAQSDLKVEFLVIPIRASRQAGQ